MNHLPLASQIEYQKLILKMNLLEEKKKKSKTVPNAVKVLDVLRPTPATTPAIPPKRKVSVKSPDSNVKRLKRNDDSKINLYLNKISKQSPEVQRRLIEKSESNLELHRYCFYTQMLSFADSLMGFPVRNFYKNWINPSKSWTFMIMTSARRKNWKFTLGNCNSCWTSTKCS